MTTLADIQLAVDAVNRLTGAPAERFSSVGNVVRSNVGHHYVIRTGGGYQLRREANADGMSENVFALAPVGRGEMHRLLWCYVMGLERR